MMLQTENGGTMHEADAQEHSPASGGGGWLRAFSFFLMIPYPLFSIFALRGMESWIASGRGTWLSVAATFVPRCFSCIAGYLLYSGSSLGRKALLLFFFTHLFTASLSIADVILPSGVAFLNMRLIAVHGVFLLITLFFLCRPQPPRAAPPPAWMKTALRVWLSLLSGGLLFFSCNALLLMHKQTLPRVPVAEGSEAAYTIVVGEHAIIIPKPAKATSVDTEARVTEYHRVIALTFVESGASREIVHAVSHFEDADAKTSPESFFNMNMSMVSLMDEIGSPLKVVDENPLYMIRLDDGGLLNGRGKLCDAQVLVGDVQLTLRIHSRSWAVQPGELLDAMREWIRGILLANHAAR